MSNVNESKYWCFTLNNYTAADESVLRELCGLGRATYLLYGREVGTDKGVPHLQGMVEFARKKRRAAVHKLLGGRCHLESRRGTSQESRVYCIKDGDYEEYGTISVPEQGRRRDLEEIFEDIRGGKTEIEIAEQAPQKWCQYGRRFERYRELLREQPRTWVTKVIILTGQTGCGKSRYVHSKEKDLFIAPDNSGKWFDGYLGHEAVLFDDFETGNPITVFLRLLDRYPMTVPKKGGFINWKPKRVYFTSNVPYTGWFTEVHDMQKAAFKRRITENYELNEDLEFDENNECISELINLI